MQFYILFLLQFLLKDIILFHNLNQIHCYNIAELVLVGNNLKLLNWQRVRFYSLSSAFLSCLLVSRNSYFLFKRWIWKWTNFCGTVWYFSRHRSIIKCYFDFKINFFCHYKSFFLWNIISQRDQFSSLFIIYLIKYNNNKFYIYIHFINVNVNFYIYLF